MLDLLEELRTLLEALDAEGIEHAVCGGLAMAIHARPRATLDVDLLVPREHLEEARQLARRAGYRIEEPVLHLASGAVEIHRLSKPDPEGEDLLSLDLVVVTPPLQDVWETRERIAWEHGTVSAVSREGLAKMKRLRGSGQDRDDIAFLLGEDRGEQD